jgi:serine/threonine protein kinase
MTPKSPYMLHVHDLTHTQSELLDFRTSESQQNSFLLRRASPSIGEGSVWSEPRCPPMEPEEDTSSWETVWHGTRRDRVESVMRHSLRPAGTRLPDGSEVAVGREGYEPDFRSDVIDADLRAVWGKAVFVFPSVWCKGLQEFAEEEADGLLLIEARVRPGSYGVFAMDRYHGILPDGSEYVSDPPAYRFYRIERPERDLVVVGATHHSPVLRRDKQIMLREFAQNGRLLQFACASVQTDREVVLAAVAQHGDALEHADASLRADREVVLAAVAQSGGALRYADASLRADREVVLAAVTQHGDALGYADASLRADREVVLAAVTQHGRALAYADASLRAEREVLLAAVAQHGRALEYADASLRADREVVLAAVAQSGYALKYADASLRADREVLLAAVAQHGEALAYAGALAYADASLRTDPAVQALAALPNQLNRWEVVNAKYNGERALPHELLRLKLFGHLQFLPKMLDEGITVEMLPSLTDDQLEKLGMTMGKRVAFMAAAKLPEPEPEPQIPEHLPPDMQAGRAVVDFAQPVLGSGGFADVHRGTYRFHQAEPVEVAFKIFRGGQALTAATRRQIEQELLVGQRLHHPNLTRLFGMVELPDRGPALVMELAAGGSLRNVLADRESHPDLPWLQRISWLRGVSEGMAELHSLLPRSIIHRDLKAANILLSTPDLATAVVKVADFGIALAMETVRATLSGGSGGMAGTLAWKAPETFRDRYSEKSDVFAFGVLCFEVVSRQLPWEGVGQPAIIERVRARFEYNEMMLTNFGVTREQQFALWTQQNPLAERRPDLALAEAGCPEALLAFVGRCWADEPDQRPRFTDCNQELTTMRPALTFAISRFKAAYEATTEPVTLATDVFHAVNTFLRQYCRVHGLTSDAQTRALERFIIELQRQTDRHNDADAMGRATNVAELLWSSDIVFEDAPEPHNKELCSLINAAIRDDHPDLAATTAKVVRCINTLCVVRGQAAPALEFPSGPPRSSFHARTLRGSSFDDTHLDFFTVGKQYRVPGFVATSFAESIALRFLRGAVAWGKKPVMWVVNVDPAGEHDAARRCKHVNYVSHTHVGGEAEFLFAPYSIFTVRKVERDVEVDPLHHTIGHRIELDAATDNRPLEPAPALELEPEPEGGADRWAMPPNSEDLPLAPWY